MTHSASTHPSRLCITAVSLDKQLPKAEVQAKEMFGGEYLSPIPPNWGACRRNNAVGRLCDSLQVVPSVAIPERLFPFPLRNQAYGSSTPPASSMYLGEFLQIV
jgi:hypothetical protein